MRLHYSVLIYTAPAYIRLQSIYTYVQQRGKKTLLSLTLICYCHLVGMAKIVRGSIFIYTTMKHRYLTIWLTYCISIASLQY